MNERLHSLTFILSALGLGLGLAGCVTTHPVSSDPPDMSPRLIEAAVRIEVPIPSDTLLDRISVGSGYLISAHTGVTCAHVVSDHVQDKPIKAQIAGNEYLVTIIGENSELDIALFRIEPPAPHRLLLRKHDEQLSVGQPVRVVGFPLPGVIVDKAPTVTGGIVSGTNRTILCGADRVNDLLQVDAVSSDGNSGAPVLTLDGEIVGMVVFAATGQRAEWRGATFALPAGTVEEAAKALLHDASFCREGEDTETPNTPSVKDLITK